MKESYQTSGDQVENKGQREKKKLRRQNKKQAPIPSPAARAHTNTHKSRDWAENMAKH